MTFKLDDRVENDNGDTGIVIAINHSSTIGPIGILLDNGEIINILEDGRIDEFEFSSIYDYRVV